MDVPTILDNFEIAPGHRVAEWKSLQLDEQDGSTADWDKAIAIFDRRIRSRFIEPAQLLIDAENSTDRMTNGFAILAIDFLLIETVQGFVSGRTNHNGHSKTMFKEFLTAWSAFTSCVPKSKTADDLAVSVYEQGRCALHHTGSTDRLVVRKSGKIFVFHDDGKIEINRTLLHQELSGAFSTYLAELKKPRCADLRKNFKTKMNHICS